MLASRSRWRFRNRAKDAAVVGLLILASSSAGAAVGALICKTGLLAVAGALIAIAFMAYVVVVVGVC
jgi:hypothetical protein